MRYHINQKDKSGFYDHELEVTVGSKTITVMTFGQRKDDPDLNRIAGHIILDRQEFLEFIKKLQRHLETDS